MEGTVCDSQMKSFKTTAIDCGSGAKCESRVQQELNRLNNSIDMIGNMVEKMGESLNPVLSPEPPIDPSSQESPDGGELVHAINAGWNTIDNISDKIKILIGRLDI